MIRQGSTATVALHCYETLAAAGYRGGGARDAGSDPTGVILSLVSRAASLAPAPARRAAPAKTTSTPTTRRSAGTAPDRTAPRVVALKSGGDRGTTIRLIYRVSDGSGRSSERVAVYGGGRVLTKSGWAPFGPANGKAYFFDFPSSARMSGTYSFCVELRDPSGNVSKPSCAPLVVF